MQKPVLIAVDWGTTNFRAWLLAAGGNVLAGLTRAAGIRQVQGAFPETLNEAIGPWQQAHPGLPVLMSGMIGSRQGWAEAPYVHCPANADAIAAGLLPVPGQAGVWIVPGVAYRPAGVAPDVMRGEETQIVGLLSLANGLAVLPGTHSKWVELRDGAITRFATYMTGELYAVLRQHSILGALMGDGDGMTGFDDGVQAGFAHGGSGFIHSLFGVRAKGLFGDLRSEDAAGYLSGLLIAGEINEALAAATAGDQAAPDGVTLAGTGPLATLYQRALVRRGVSVDLASDDVAARGLWRIAVARGLVANHD